MMPLLQFNNVSLKFGAKYILNGLNLNVSEDDFIILLGANGSGKSSLMKLINRTYHPITGDLLYQKDNIQALSEKKIMKEIVTINQFIVDSLFLEMTVQENAILIENTYCDALNLPFSRKKFKQELPDYLASFNEKLARNINTPVSCLSGGEQQMLAFSLYLRRDPKLLLLDEHTSALDPKKAEVVMSFIDEYLRKKKMACVMTTHQLDHALKYGNRLIAISDGAVVFDVSGKDKSTLTMHDLLAYCY